MADWERVNVWTNTLYALIQALSISKRIQFGNLPLIGESVRDAGSWIFPDCTYNSVLLAHPFGDRSITFRRDPNAHFSEIARQIVVMLLQDLVVIFDDMMTDILMGKSIRPGKYPQTKVRQLEPFVASNQRWAVEGCLEMIAVRNVLVHYGGKWNVESLKIITPFVSPPPNSGDALSVGFSMLFRYRKAVRTFLNQAVKQSHP
jgi:hypothetical protein